jgi:hypothetical protein
VRSSRRALLLAIALSACGSVSPPIESTARDFVPLYYVESQRVEPWGPEVNGSFRPDWEASARDDLTRAGLTPNTLDQLDLRASDLHPAMCAQCPSLFVLKVEVPRSQEGVAVGRCFVRRLPDFRSATSDALTAARRTDCSPLYR